MNAAGRELGLRLHYDKTSVSHWLAGSVPKPEARPAVTEALSRLLGRPVTCGEIGWPTGAGPAADRDVVTGVIDLSRADMDPSRRGVLKTGMYAAALAVPRFEDLADPAERADAVAAGRTVHIGRSDVETVRTMTDKVADILDQVGAGHARPMAAAFLVNTAGPYLQGAERTRSPAACAPPSRTSCISRAGWPCLRTSRAWARSTISVRSNSPAPPRTTSPTAAPCAA
ncbi:hypothetical protein [Streptomyces malaysiensis]|uniref:hypothetical protein n=1 Tax=Streptomyces malaysiensis TaxID=92644 RepID=UPI002F908627